MKDSIHDLKHIANCLGIHFCFYSSAQKSDILIIMQGMLPAVALHPSKPDSTLCSWAGPAKAALARPGGVDLGKGRACLYQMGSMGSHKARPVPTRPVQQAGAAADWSPHPPLCLHSPGCGGSFWVCMSVAVPCTLCTALACSVILDTPAACMKSVMCMLDKCTGSWFELLMTFATPPPPSPPYPSLPRQEWYSCACC